MQKMLRSKAMRRLVIYFVLSFFCALIVFSFYIKWGRIDAIEFDAQGSWLKIEKRNQVIKELQDKTQPFIGKWIWNLSITKLQKLVSSHPQVGQVRILRSWPNRFRIFLLSEKPILLYVGQKSFLPVTSDGKFLESVSILETPDLPFLRGDIFFNQEDLRKQVSQFFLYLPKEGLFSQENISEIRYSKKDQNFYFYLLRSGRPVQVGENLVEFRPDRVESVLKYLDQKKIKWRVIDARFSKKVIVSLDKNPASSIR